MKRLLFSIIGLLALLAALGAALMVSPRLLVSAAPPAQDTPTGFTEILSRPGVTLLKKDYDNGTPDYVQEVRLDEGATLRILAGEAQDAGIGQGAYGGDSPTFTRQSLRQFWNGLESIAPHAFCITNGAFFSTDVDPSPLAFPLKKDGRLLTEGYGRDEYPGQKYMLELWEGRAEINPLTPDALRESTAPDIIAGLDETADKSHATLTGRTFVGIADRNADGSAETVLLFNTQTSTQADAAGVLRSFGAVAVMMLDGGDSTQLMCDSDGSGAIADTSPAAYIASTRTLPQALAVLSRRPAPLSADVVRQSTFPILIEGETTLIEIEMRNAGSEAWREGSDRLVNLKNPYGAKTEYPLQQEILPGQTTLFSWRTESFPKTGVYTTDWQMQRGGDMIEGSFVRVTVIVLPEELEEQRAELEGRVREWAAQKVDDIEALILAWIQEQLDRIVKDTTSKLCGSPLLPIIAAAALALRRWWKA